MRWISTVLRWVALLLAACSGLTLFTSAVAGMLVGAGNVALGGPTYFHGVVFFVAVLALEVGLLVGGVIASVVHHPPPSPLVAGLLRHEPDVGI